MVNSRNVRKRLCDQFIRQLENECRWMIISKEIELEVLSNRTLNYIFFEYGKPNTRYRKYYENIRS